jgi:hypothetical protein
LKGNLIFVGVGLQAAALKIENKWLQNLHRTVLVQYLECLIWVGDWMCWFWVGVGFSVLPKKVSDKQIYLFP